MATKRKVVIDTAGSKNSKGVSANGLNERAVTNYIANILVTRLKANGFDCVLVKYRNKDKAEDSKLIDDMIALRKGWKKKDCIFIDLHASYSASSGQRGACYVTNSGGSASKLLGEHTLSCYVNGMKKIDNKTNSGKSHSNASYSQLKGWHAAMQFHPINIRSKADCDLYKGGKQIQSGSSLTGIAHTSQLSYSTLVANAILEGVCKACNVSSDNGNAEGDLLGADGGLGDASNAMASTMGSVNPEGSTGSADAWIGTKFGEEYDYNSVTFSQLLEASYDEKKYGPNIAQISQPLIKFTNAGAYYDMESEDNADATEVLKQYAKFYLESNNARVDTCEVQIIGAPWLRPGFNVWLDPIYEDKIYYIDSITHSGNPSSGAYTNLTLSYGRRRTDFLSSGKKRKLGALGDDDNIFTKDKYYKSAKDFGTVLDSASDFNSYKAKLKQIEDTLKKDKSIVLAHESPYVAIYKDQKGDSALRNPTINVVNEAGEVIFEKEEWEAITGRHDYDKLLKDQKQEAKSDDNNNDEKDPDDDAKGTKDKDSDNNKKDDNKKDGKKGSSSKPSASKSSTTKNKNNTSTNTSTTKKNLQDSDDTKMSWKSGRFVCDNNLKKGKTGSTVKQLQAILNKFIDDGTIKGDKLTVDGKFGTKTETRLKAYQKAKKLKADGVCGSKTVARINKDLGFSEKTSLSEGVQIETADAKGRLTDAMFTGSYTIDQIQSQLNSLYSKAPEVVTRRRNVIKAGCEALRSVMDSYYVNNDWNK